ncbi:MULTISPECIES: hypothetical protein [unclassified Amycolatopsis]|uniref:hypothetical protein n=1 Tax=unclassified Amycolatopsis TaxID=2618356 RepID=UPI001C69F61E|nr:hypothetical protein [Amycolatopsis sp. DSM 110486]QYN21513.1 hypothetical protein K1T34_02905 [Amycolatopsis sp. DSM 110486]
MDPRETYAAMPNVADLGDLPDAWHWASAPGFDYSAALYADGKRAFQAFALDSYDEELAVALLSFARSHGAELATDAPLSLAEGFAPAGYGFDAVAAAGPLVHRLYPDDAEMHDAVRAVIPIFRCEAAGDEPLPEAEYRYSRGNGIRGTSWDRPPSPYLKYRYRGATGSVQAKRGFAGLKSLVSTMTRGEGRDDLFVEFENYRHEVYTVTWTDTWTLTGPDGVATPVGLEELLEAVKVALYGPNIEYADFPG